MSGEAIDILGQLIVTKIKKKDVEERIQAVDKIFDALFEPQALKNERLERLIGFLRDMYDNLDEASSISLTLQIEKLCMDVREQHDNNRIALVSGDASKASYADTPKWMDKDKKVGKMVRIKSGQYCGIIAHVEQLDLTKNYVVVKLADGKEVKYALRNIELLDWLKIVDNYDFLSLSHIIVWLTIKHTVFFYLISSKHEHMKIEYLEEISCLKKEFE